MIMNVFELLVVTLIDLVKGVLVFFVCAWLGNSCTSRDVVIEYDSECESEDTEEEEEEEEERDEIEEVVDIMEYMRRTQGMLDRLTPEQLSKMGAHFIQ